MSSLRRLFWSPIFWQRHLTLHVRAQPIAHLGLPWRLGNLCRYGESKKQRLKKNFNN
jgi:hypothetical protein